MTWTMSDRPGYPGYALGRPSAGSRMTSVCIVAGLHMLVALLLLSQVRAVPVPVEPPLLVAMLDAEVPPEIPPVAAVQPQLTPTLAPTLPMPVVPVAVQSPMTMQMAAAPAVAAPRAVEAAAPQTVARKSEGVPPDYLAVLMTHLAKAKRYPMAARRLRQQGIVHLRFTMSRTGRVVSANLDMPCGFEALNLEAMELLRRAAPLPRLPDDMPDLIELVIPIEFSLR